ncbi:quinoprotein dehydrogenase-associated SoxYZ-like carrier [Polaromonas sp.]|uniref:quinoprotein dehydrogenase-associated SoxYZ-like carrier n=1 Tax=Polaromonas sp. TaxID=1869339 RepID=UPI001A24FBE2|nr:quinoprotein dehydrogenase-associated SoxYZ-like carrier [Burkholderiales bacterium]MBH2019450.1 quinoprotein dehydrogenase-associated SoxYZ-like carrier [Burkholderiales bacterium]
MTALIHRRGLLLRLGTAGLVAGGLPLALHAQNDLSGGDPLQSLQWPGMRKQYLGDAPMRFSQEVVVKGPAFADDAISVPIFIDARALSSVGGGVERIEVVSDRNPIREVLSFEPLLSLPMLAFRFRMEQASPVRAMVKTRDGQWHVGSTWVQAAGGGCTVPGATRADGSWSRTLNQVQARFFSNVLAGSQRLRVRIMHPMDTGLVAGIPAFYVENLQLVDAAGQVWWRLALHEPVSENPLLTFELPERPAGRLRLVGRDNNGNPIDAEVAA